MEYTSQTNMFLCYVVCKTPEKSESKGFAMQTSEQIKEQHVYYIRICKINKYKKQMITSSRIRGT